MRPPQIGERLLVAEPPHPDMAKDRVGRMIALIELAKPKRGGVGFVEISGGLRADAAQDAPSAVGPGQRVMGSLTERVHPDRLLRDLDRFPEHARIAERGAARDERA